MEPVQEFIDSTPPRRPAVIDGRAAGKMARRAWPGRSAWDHQMHWLEQVHEAEMSIPTDAARDVATRLGVTVESVLGRFGEHARTIVRGWNGEVEPDVLAAAVTARDFRAAAAILRDSGVDAPSLAIERLLRAAPGPAAARLRVRESARRTADATTRHRLAA